MKSKLIHHDGVRTYAIVFDEDDEVMEGLQQFAAEHDLKAARFTAIGALSRATLGFFNLERKDYDRIPVEEQVEVLVFAGNVARYEGKPKIHAHIVLSKRDGSALGGQLMEGYVRPTFEVILTESSGELERRVDEKTGLPLLRL